VQDESFIQSTGYAGRPAEAKICTVRDIGGLFSLWWMFTSTIIILIIRKTVLVLLVCNPGVCLKKNKIIITNRFLLAPSRHIEETYSYAKD